MATVEAEKEMLDPNVLSDSVVQNFHCNEMEERRRKAEVRCGELEFELQKKKDQCESLEAKVKTLEGQKFAVEEELKVLRMLSEDGLKGKIEVCSEKERVIKVHLPEDDNEAVQLMIENKVLECEKKKAESEVEFWKEKYKNLESRALQLGMGSGSNFHDENGKKQINNQTIIEGNLHLDTRIDEKDVDLGNVMQSAGTPPCGIFHRSPKVQPSRKVRKLLRFETEESPSKKMAPSTPVGPASASIDVIDILDCDDEPNVTQNLAPDRQSSGNFSRSTYFSAAKEKNFDSNYARNNNENMDVGDNHTFASTPKRKRRCNVFISESESDHDHDDDNMRISKSESESDHDDDNMRISKSESESDHDDDNMRISRSEPVMTRRRLRPLRKCVSRSLDDKRSSSRPHKVKHEQTIPTNDDAEDDDDDEPEEDLSQSEGGNMSDFIVNDSDVSNCEDSSSKLEDESNSDVGYQSSNSQDLQDSNEDYDSQDVSDGDMDFGNIISKFRRRKKNEMKWEFEADMLAAFGKDSELCMKAVCALYRQQTSEEKVSKEALCHNRRGFSKFHAHRGSILAEFLTDGDPRGALRKTVKELQEYDTEAVEHCRSLAIHYSKQLYQIYMNKEDPFFP